jgi:hypothetical protein
VLINGLGQVSLVLAVGKVDVLPAELPGID